MEIKTLLIELLESFGFPVYLQGSMADDEAYPDSFFTFWNNETLSDRFYDDSENVVIWDFDVNMYSNDPAIVNSKLAEAVNKLKENEFIIDGYGYDVISDYPTHTGRGINVLYISKK